MAIEDTPSSTQSSYDDPLYLSSSDHAAMQLTARQFDGSNYLGWARSARLALSTKSKLGFVTGTCVKPDSASSTLSRWLRCDSMVNCWILNSLSVDIAESVGYLTSSKDLWDELKERYSQSNGPLIYQLRQEMYALKQNNMSVSAYYTRLKRVYDELKLVEVFPQCACEALTTCKCCKCDLIQKFRDIELRNQLLQFLMGLDDDYEQVRGQILGMDPFPPINRAFYLVQQIEKQREITSISTTSSKGNYEACAVNKPYGRVNTNGSTSGYGHKKDFVKTKPGRFCTHCKMKSHNVDQCFKLHVYPEWFTDKMKSTSKPRMAAQVHSELEHTEEIPDSPLMEVSHEQQVDLNQRLMAVTQEFMRSLKIQQPTGGASESCSSVNFAAALFVSPVAATIIGVGNSAVIIGLWPAHFIWTCYCVGKTRKLGMILKILMLFSLPIPLILWPVVGILGSFIGGIGFGFFAPLLATFEAVGETVTNKFYHCLVDGCWTTIEGSCTVVRDFTDFCFHSYFSYMDELSMNLGADEMPSEIMVSRLPGCFLIALLALVVDVPAITILALWKSPYMLYTGWKRLLEDLIGREGPFLETVCVPFAGLAIILWPLAVVSAVIAAFLSSFFLGLYAGVVFHQENSIKMGLAYTVAIISEFDEYVNDLLYLTEGSCLPRPRYRKHTMTSSCDSIQRKASYDCESKLVSEHSRTLKIAIQQYKPIRVLDWLFKSCEVNGRKLFRDGLINVEDIEGCVVKGDFKKLGIVLPAWCILKCLLASAKSDSPGLIIPDEENLKISDWPRDKMFQWLIGPLLIMKEQIRKLNLDENEEACLRKAVMQCKNDTPEDWDDIGFPSKDPVRRAQIQSVVRRLQGIVGSLARMPTFRRRFQNLVKVLYMEAAKTGALVDYVVEKSAAEGENSGDHRQTDIV